MAMSGNAANGGDENSATFGSPLAQTRRPTKTELRKVGPGQYGFVAIKEDLPPVRVKNSDGTTRIVEPAPLEGSTVHAEFSEIGLGAEQTGFDTVELPIIRFDPAHE